jgi:DNA-directed RNA polymerase alpha subunit
MIEMGADAAILYKPIKDLHASDEFLKMCKRNNFKNLNDILELHLNDMLLKPQFGMRMLKELYSFLKAEGLEKLLKEK